jgi:LacI family transcriptional regulator
MKKVTMQDIADKLGVTKVTISKAINNQPGISDDLRGRILYLAEQMGYVKLKNDSSEQSYRFAWITPKRFFLEDESFYTTIYYYINEKCVTEDFDLNCFIVNEDEELNMKLPARMQEMHFDGIFVGGELESSYMKKIEALNIPIIAVDFYHSDIIMDSIVSDNFNMGFEIADYLIKKGHKRIGFVGSYLQTASICDRYFGYCKAMKLKDLEIKEEWHIVNNNVVTGEYSVNFDLPEDMPTAFICHCDKAAYTLMQKLGMSGYKIPQEVSVVSFDNTDLCNLMNPSLSSVDINKKQLAISSMNQMMFRMKNPKAPLMKAYKHYQLIERLSVHEI